MDANLIFYMRVVTSKGPITKPIEMQKKTDKHCNYVRI